MSKNTTLQIRINEDLKQQFDKACEDNYTDKTEQITRLIVEYLKENKKEEK